MASLYISSVHERFFILKYNFITIIILHLEKKTSCNIYLLKFIASVFKAEIPALIYKHGLHNL